MSKAKIFMPILLSAVLTGCTFGTNIDTLMTPPKLSVEQEQIYSALTNAAGTSIKLKYPKSGTYLSAFIIDDIDGDGGNEAVVFYEKNGLTVEENTLRINILDKNDDKWHSVCDTTADGSEIEKVMISKLGSSNRVSLIIGCSLINRSEKNVSLYSYSDGRIEQTFTSPYSFFDVTDLDSDNENEFLLLTGASFGVDAAAKAYKFGENGKYVPYSKELSGNFTEFDNISYGKLGNGSPALYIDAVSGNGMIQSDIIYMDDKGLNKIFSTSDESSSTMRPSGCTSFDVDGDGIPEIPVQSIFSGYEGASESEQLMVTDWMCINENNQLEKKYSSYFSVTDGYIFLMPEKWLGKITIKRDSVNDEMVFCKYSDGMAGRELLRIFCAEDTASREDRIANGYMLIHSKGESAYLAYIPPVPDTVDDGLSVSAGEVAVGFKYKE